MKYQVHQSPRRESDFTNLNTSDSSTVGATEAPATCRPSHRCAIERNKHSWLSTVRLLVGITVLYSFGHCSLTAAEIIVQNLDDSGPGSLRQGIIEANNSSEPTVISALNISGTIALASPLPFITSGITLNGPGANSLTVSGSSLYRPFLINAPGKQVSINNLSINDGLAKGGNGGNGGGGGGGFGGGLFVTAGDVTLSNVTFANNRAAGGNGATYSIGISGGGGGGIQGNGGNGGNATYDTMGGGGGGGLTTAGENGFFGISGTRGGAGGGPAGGLGSFAGTGLTGGAGDDILGGGGGGGGLSGVANPDGGKGGKGGLGSGGGGGGGSGGPRFPIPGVPQPHSYSGSGGAGGFGGGGGAGGYYNGAAIWDGAEGNPYGSRGGSGGFGGGGGGSGSTDAQTFPSDPGNGGFGGGGGGRGGFYFFNPGSGPLIPGTSSRAGGGGGGGGGAGMGGSIFYGSVTGDASLTLIDVSFGSSTVSGGNGGGGDGFQAGGGGGGAALGSSIFLYGGTNTFIVSSGESTISGDIADWDGAPGHLVKSGPGTLVLSGGNSGYHGNTFVDAGTLRVNGSISSSGNVVIANGAFLAGGGTVGPVTLNPGATMVVGLATLRAGNSFWNGAGNINWQILDGDGAPGSGYGTVKVNGNLDLSSASGFNINLWSLASGAGVSGNALNFNSSGQYEWTLVETTGGITGFNPNNFIINTAAHNGTGGFANPVGNRAFTLAVVGKKLVLSFINAEPEIVIEQPPAATVASGDRRDFGSADVGSNTTLEFNLRNIGGGNLILSGTPLSVSGANAEDFEVIAQPASTVSAVGLASPGFELPVLGNGSWRYGPGGTLWTFGLQAGVARNGSPWFVNDAPQGAQAAYVQNTYEAFISRTINFPAAGNYLIRFSMVRRSEANPANTIEVRMDGTALRTVSHTEQPDNIWRTFSVPYVCPSAGGHELAFVGKRGGGDYASAIDDIQIQGTTSFTVKFAPTGVGPRTAVLSIASNDGDANPYEIILTGTGTGVANNAPTLASINDPAAIEEDSGLQTVELNGISAGLGELQPLTVTATSGNTLLIPHPTVIYSSPSATGLLNFAPLANASGTALITVTVNDGGFANNITTQTFTVTVNPVNDAPTLAPLSDPVAIDEDAGLQTINLSGISAGGGESQTLTITATSGNTSLIPHPTVTYTSPNSTGFLSYTPVANASGTALITVTVEDGGLANNITTQTFAVTVNPVNDAPTLAPISDPTAIDEDAGLQTINLAGIGAGGGETQTLTITATSGNPSLLPHPTVAYTSPNTTGTLSYTPVPNASGTALITVTVNDGGTANNLTTQSFTVTVNAVNDPPTLATITDPTAIDEDAGLQTITLTGIAAGGGEMQTLTVTATSGNTSLIPDPTVTYTSPEGTGSLSYTPVANASGTAVITVRVDDGASANNLTTQTFTVTVNPINDRPTLAPISDPLAIDEDSGLQTISLAGISAGGGETQTLTVTATSGNTSLIPNPAVTYTSPDATGSLSYTPVPNASGTALITVTVNDGAAANNLTTQTFTVTVNPVNDPPTLAPISNPAAINKNAGLQTVTLTGISAGAGESQTLTVTATSGNTSLIPNPTVTYVSPSSTGSLSYTPVANASGTALISVTVNDGGSLNNTVTETFTVTVNAANEPPTATNLSAAEIYVEDTTLNLTDIVVTDADSPNITATLTLSDPKAGSLSTATSGAVTSTFTAATGIWTASGAIADVNTLLAGLCFIPAPDLNADFTIATSVTDGVAPAVIGNKSLTGTAANDAPVLNSAATPALSAQNEDSPAPVGAVGTPVSSLVDFAKPAGQLDNVTDVDSGASLGVAITSAYSANGAWFYSLNGGTSWSALGPVSVSSARLLAATGNNRLYFQPSANFNGNILSALTFRAWDQTSGTDGGLANTSPNGATTAFSVATDTASLNVKPINDPPVATPGYAYVYNNAPTILSVLANANAGPADENQTLTLNKINGRAISVGGSVNSAHGTLTLNADSTVTFKPTAGYIGVETFTFQVSDTGTPVLSTTATVTLTVVPPSVATDSSLSLYDLNGGANNGRQFRLIFTPDPNNQSNFRLATSNPGQQFYNLFYIGTPGPHQLTVNIPYPFVTHGDFPLSAYDGAGVTTDAAGDPRFVPGHLLAVDNWSLTLADYDSNGDHVPDQTLHRVSFEVTVPASGFLYLTIALDYGLRGSGPYVQGTRNNADAAMLPGTTTVVIPKSANYPFSFAVDGVTKNEAPVQSLNDFKRQPGFAGMVLEDSACGADPLSGRKIQIFNSTGALISTATTDEDGWYSDAYKHKAKTATYTIKLLKADGVTVAQTKTITVLANGAAEVNFTEACPATSLSP